MYYSFIYNISNNNKMCENINFLNVLKQEALKSPLERRCAAVIVCRGKIMSVGYNYYKRGCIADNYCLLWA